MGRQYGDFSYEAVIQIRTGPNLGISVGGLLWRENLTDLELTEELFCPVKDKVTPKQAYVALRGPGG
jgi:hypothetical protein